MNTQQPASSEDPGQPALVRRVPGRAAADRDDHPVGLIRGRGITPIPAAQPEITYEQWLLVRKLFSKRCDLNPGKPDLVTPLRRVNSYGEEPANDGPLVAHREMSPIRQNVG